MAGQIKKDDIIQQKEIQEALAAIAKSVMNVASAFDQVAKSSKAAFESTKKAQTTKDLSKESQESAKNTTAQATAEKKLNTEIAKTNKLLSEEEKLKRKVKQSTEQLALARSKDNKILQQNRQRMAEINREFKEQVSKGSSLTQSFRGLAKSVVAYAAAYAGLRAIVRFFTQDLFNLTKALDSVQFSMKTVIKDNNELIATQEFLRRTAINYGQDLLTLSERYTKFRAASLQSNLTSEETMNIFDSMAKAAGVLGLKTDELNGVFLALEQMISKGKVTTEELRRQLGERLPGAMGIMADSMGVSISQLDKMLKMGEVLSAEVLPGFAQAVEEAYGIESVNKIDTLAAAHGRLATSWKLFVDELAAGGAYQAAIENWTNAFSRIRIWGEDIMGDGSGYLEKYSLMTTKAGDATNKLVAELDKLTFAEIETQEVTKKSIDQLTKEGITLSHATAIWTDYYNARVAANSVDNTKMAFTKPLDFEEEEKRLDQAAKEFKSYSLMQEGELKKQFELESGFIDERTKTEKDYLRFMADKTKKETDLAYQKYLELENLERELTKDEKIELGLRYENYQNYFKLRVEINDRLNEKKKGGTKRDDSLSILREQQKAELEATRQHQQELMTLNNYSEEELIRVRFDNSKELLNQELKGLEEQKLLVKDNALETAKIDYDIAKVRADIAKDLTEFLIDEEERRQKELERVRKQESDDFVAGVYEQADIARIKRAEQARMEMQDLKGNAKKKKSVQIKTAIDMLAIEYRAQQKIIDSAKTTEEEKAKAAEMQLKLKEQLEVEAFEGSVELTKLQREEYRKTVDAVAQVGSQMFDVIGGFYDNQMTKIEQMHDFEIAAAGDSVEKRIMAERKYDREKSKLMRKQAVMQKAQSAFNIIINTAEAIMATLGETGFFGTPLAAIIGALGAAQLATVLAAPIPKFAKGTKDAPQTFIAGEAGQEAIIKPSGQVVLTPDAPTVFSDKSFVGSTILPADQTQRMLANYAIKQSYDMIDMSESNKQLKVIANNTKNKREVFVNSQGRTVIKRGYITSTLV